MKFNNKVDPSLTDRHKLVSSTTKVKIHYNKYKTTHMLPLGTFMLNPSNTVKSGGYTLHAFFTSTAYSIFSPIFNPDLYCLLTTSKSQL